MNLRRWIGVAAFGMSLLLGIGLQVYSESVYEAQITTTGPEEPIVNDNSTFQVLGTAEIRIHPNWAIAAPLSLFALAGVLLALIPDNCCSRTGRR